MLFSVVHGSASQRKGNPKITDSHTDTYLESLFMDAISSVAWSRERASSSSL